MRRAALLLSALLLAPAPPAPGQPKKEKEPEPVEPVGTPRDFFFTRNWNVYYWREDFSFLLKDEKTGKEWRVLSREPTPHYDWRLGPTYTGLKVDWKAPPRVKVFGVTGVDRIPKDFYDFKLNEPNVATAFVVWAEAAPGTWREWYVNNWFHRWGAAADAAVHKRYADRPAPYDVYGYLDGQSAPFSPKARELIRKHPKARTFHGLIKTSKASPGGVEIELLHLFGPDAGGNGVVFFGNAADVPKLDKKKGS